MADELLVAGRTYVSRTYEQRTITAMTENEICWMNPDTGNTGCCSRRSFFTWMRRVDYGGRDRTDTDRFRFGSRADDAARLQNQIGKWMQLYQSDTMPLEYWLARESLEHIEALLAGKEDYIDHRIASVQSKHKDLRWKTWGGLVR